MDTQKKSWKNLFVDESYKYPNTHTHTSISSLLLDDDVDEAEDGFGTC